MNKNKKESFFITGGMGYIGSVFAREALKRGHSVCLYDSLVYEQHPNRILKEITGGPENPKLKHVIGDTRNRELLVSSITKFKPTYVMHFGELSSVHACNHNPTFTESINFNASKQVLEVCEDFGIKVIYNSTSSVYGTQKGFKLMKEDDIPPVPTDYYCQFKLKMEDYIKERLEKNKNFKIITFRPATVFGLSPRFRIELLPNHFTYMAISKKLIPLSGLNAYRAAIDIDHLVEGYFKVIEKGSWKHWLYNIGHHNLNKKQFATGIRRVVPCKLGAAPDIGDLRNLQIDCSRFNKEFGFKPSTSYEKSIRKIAKWLQKNFQELENKNFAELLNMPLERWRQICS